MNRLCTFLFPALLLMNAPICQADVLLKDTQGKQTSFAGLHGKWVFINYWASWCKTCVDEIPEFNRFYQKHAQEKIALFAVNYDALPLVKQNHLIKKLNIQYPSLATDPALALGLGDIVGVPVTFIFNPQGELVHTLYGGQDVAALEAVIAKK